MRVRVLCGRVPLTTNRRCNHCPQTPIHLFHISGHLFFRWFQDHGWVPHASANQVAAAQRSLSRYHVDAHGFIRYPLAPRVLGDTREPFV